MIRWSYVLPRLLIIGVLLGFAAFGLDPLLRWTLVRTGEKLTGGRVDLASVRTSLAGAKIQLTGLAAAAPSSPMQNLLEADLVVLDLDAEALLLRRLVVDRGHISGMQVNGDRATSGELDGAALAEPRADSSGLPEFDNSWLSSMGKAALEEITDDFESVRMIDSAKGEWEQKFLSWKARIKLLRDRAKTLKAQYQNIDRRDPAQIARAYQQLPRDIHEVRSEFEALRREIEGIQAAADGQLADLSGAHQRDLQRWRQKIRIDQFNALELTNYFLGPMLNERMSQVLTWVEQCQTIADMASPPKTRQLSTEEIRFGKIAEPPNCLIRQLLIDGFIEINGENTPFGVVASDIAFPPSLHSKPTRLRMLTQGNFNVQVDGVLDYRGENSIKQFHVACPDVAIPQTILGKEGEFAVHSQRGQASVHCDATYENGGVRGRVDFVQTGVQLRAEVAESLGDRVRGSLQQSLDEINQLAATVHFQGDPRLPSWTIESELGGHLSSALRNVAAVEIEHQQARLRSRLDAELATRKAEFDELIEKKKQALLADLNLNSQQLQQIMNLTQQFSIGRLKLPNEFSLDGLLSR